MWPWMRSWLSFFGGSTALSQAEVVFTEMKRAGCDPNNIVEPCIPFGFIWDGSSGNGAAAARAHVMCRRMIVMGLRPEKVWIRAGEGGSLPYIRIATANSQHCLAYLHYDVAPTLWVRTGFFSSERMVIDPALCEGPVTVQQWKDLHSIESLKLTLAYSEPSTFYLWDEPKLDDDLRLANRELEMCRQALADQVREHGAPPYRCPR